MPQPQQPGGGPSKDEVHARINDWAREAGGNGPHVYLKLHIDPAQTKVAEIDALMARTRLTHYAAHSDHNAEEFMLLFHRQHFGDYLANGVSVVPREGHQQATYEVSFKRDLITFARFWGRPQAAVCDRTVIGTLTGPGGEPVTRWEVSYGGGANGVSKVVKEGTDAASLRAYMKLDG